MVKTLVGFVVCFSAATNETPAVWHDDYAKAVAEACSNDKPLFIVFCSKTSEYAKMAGLGTFVGSGAERSLKLDYVRLMIDTDADAGRDLARQFDASHSPHFVILDRSGKWQVYYQSGYLVETDLAPVLARFRRSKLSTTGLTVHEVAARRQVTQPCST